MLIVKIITIKTTQIVQNHMHLFSCPAKVIPAIFTTSIFSVHFPTNLSTKLFLHLQFSKSKYSPTSHDLWYSQSQLLGHLYQSSLCIHTCIYHYSTFVYYYKHLHQVCIHIYTFCAILCLVSLVLDIRLNTLTINFLTTSGTHSFARGLLILLQLPLHLLVLILKGKTQDHIH